MLYRLRIPRELLTENIKLVGTKAERRLIRRRGKSEVDEMAPILPVVEEIIEKYKNDPYCIANNCLFPVPANTNYNGYLKEIADLCDIQRELKTHFARHTFADIMLNICGVPLEDVSKMLFDKKGRFKQIA